MQDEFVDQAGFERLPDALRRERNVEVATALLSRRADEGTQCRYEDLADCHCEGRLTATQLRELESLVRRNFQISVLKAEAQKCLHQRSI
jgi:hypothetical protein